MIYEVELLSLFHLRNNNDRPVSADYSLQAHQSTTQDEFTPKYTLLQDRISCSNTSFISFVRGDIIMAMLVELLRHH